MDKIIIEATKYSPRVELNPAGEIRIQGRSIHEDSSKFYEPIFRWVKEYSTGTLKVDIKLEYINSSSSKQLFNLLRLVLENFKINMIDHVHVNWYYEEGDDDTFELGKEFESEFMLPFVFLEYSETAA
jgi:hypothetical protein